MERKTIVVCGASGNQGGAVVQSLLRSQQWNIVALSRNPDSERMMEFKRTGVMIKSADLQGKASLTKAIENAYGCFGVTQPWSSDYKKVNIEGEIEQGRNIVDACLEAGVKHLVQSTALHFGTGKTEIPHVDSKLVIEEYLMKNKVPHTLLRPASFMDNIGTPFFPVKKGSIKGFVDGDAKVPYIACEDIGEFARLAFEHPDDFIGKEINMIGDFVSGEELCQSMSKLRDGEHFSYKTTPKLLMRIFANEFYKMRTTFEKYGRPPYPPEVQDVMSECKRMHPKLLSVEQYLKAKGYQTKQL
jgi:uncharacterized protein YbjT (DUF2867 family)